MPGDAICVVTGDCTAVYDGAERTEHRGRLTVLVKPDNTVLVHDAGGYRPVAWLTRADAVICDRESRAAVTARSGDERLRVLAHGDAEFVRNPTSTAGEPVGDCPDCRGALVRTTRTGGAVVCLGCDARHGLPAGAEVRDERCDCGLPRLRVERGAVFDVCLDRTCEPLAAAVRERFDGEWDCPVCGSDLRVLRRGGLMAGCADYPDCEAGFSLPVGVVDGDCDCGLPAFRTSSGRQCLDPACGG